MKKLFTLLAGLTLVQAAPAVVTLPFYDDFNYTAAVNLGGVGSWVATSGSGTIKVGSASLSFPALTNSLGKNVAVIPGGSGVRVDLNYTAQTSGTFYFSFLLKVNSLPGTQSLIAYASSSSSSDTTPPLGFFIKTGGQLGIGVNTSMPQFSSATLNVGQTYLVVAGYTFGASDAVEVWLDPESLGGSAPAVTGSFSATHNTSLSHFLWNTTSGVGGSYEVDELRIGATYAEVTPPASGTPPATNNAPRITQARHTGTHFILRGTHGTAGSGYEILCATNVSLPLNQWSVIGSNNFSGTGSFDVTNPLAAGPAQAYYCIRVGGSGGGDNTNPPDATPPSITSQPQNQSAALGQGALFSVGASGSAPLTYQWYFNTNTLITDATNLSHTISSVSSNDVGSYHVIVANSSGSVTSAVATLTLTAAPTNGNWFVSPTGNDANPGTIASPFATLGKAASVALPGQTIYLRGGTYLPSATIHLTNSGTLGNRINLLAHPGELPFLNFSNQPYGSANRGLLFTTNANHWNVKGLEIAYAGDNAIKVEGSYLRFEQCVLHNNGDTGLQIGFGHTDSNPGGLLAAFVEVVNCDSYLNYDNDSKGGDADGFAAKMHCGQGIVFTGCRSWENSDDGWDLFETDYSITISNCWQWHSGDGSKYVVTGGSFAGNGNGLKLGGNGTGGSSMGTHYAIRCIAFNNNFKSSAQGFTQNSHKDGNMIINCLSIANSGYNYFFEGSLNSGKQNVFKNNVGIPSSGRDFISDNAPLEVNNSWNLAVTANTADFVSVLETAAKAPRQPDGSLPTGFARLITGSDLIDQGVDVGIPFNGNAPDLGAFEFTP